MANIETILKTIGNNGNHRKQWKTIDEEWKTIENNGDNSKTMEPLKTMENHGKTMSDK